MKHIHLIGICGVAMSAIAAAFHKKGWKVTGSDAGFFPPISTLLQKNKIEFYPGWHPEKMGNPDLTVVGNVASSHNPELTAAQKQKLNYRSYPEVIAEYFVKPNSIVTAGTYGKTTSAALLTWILLRAKRQPSYMFGGLTLDETPSAQMSGGEWSVIEGDEYKSSRWDARPKFAHYSPTHLLLTSVSWDHADVYPTPEKYRAAFLELVKGLPKTGLLVAGADDSCVKTLIEEVKAKVLTYGALGSPDYRYSEVAESAGGLTFTITHEGQVYHLRSSLLGQYQAENATGCFALAHAIGVEPEKIVRSIASFAGMKRRLEKRLAAPVTVFDDIAHSPAKVSTVLATLRRLYPKSTIAAVFEPNTGNRRAVAMANYYNAFRDADLVFIPRLTTIKNDPKDADKPLDGSALAQFIAGSHGSVHYEPDDDKLVAEVIKSVAEGDVVAFMGSHGFRGMIEGVIDKLI